MKVTLAFDKTGAGIELPARLSVDVLESRFAEALDDPEPVLEASLRDPIGCPPLEQMASGKRSAAISVCDITRPAPNRTVLPVVVGALERAGIPSSEIRILIATGLHREAIEKDAYFAESETPCLVGRAIAALAADPNVAAKSGGLFSSWALAKEYGFTDLDGRQPDWSSFLWRKVQEILERGTPPDEMDRFVVRSRLYQAELDPSAAEEAERLRAWLGRHE